MAAKDLGHCPTLWRLDQTQQRQRHHLHHRAPHPDRAVRLQRARSHPSPTGSFSLQQLVAATPVRFAIYPLIATVTQG